MDRKTQQTLTTVVILLIALVAYWLKSREEAPPPPTPPGLRSQMALGNPSGATENEANADNYLMRKPYFALAYNNEFGRANWVSWSLRGEDFGNTRREDQFVPDSLLPKSFQRITTSDYSGSGFDRGHMCPHADRTSSPEASAATFVMTNIVPQSPNNNQRAWNDFEDYCRSLVREKRQTLHIVAGPQGHRGEGRNGFAESIGKGRHRVAVPAVTWKVVLALDDGDGSDEDASRVTPQTRVIAVVMPNDQTVELGWAKYRTSVRQVEALTGYNFFDRVPAAVAEALKSRVDALPIPPTGRPRTEN